MAGTGKRIYGNVDIRDVQRCCPVTIKRTVNGTVERRNSSDVGVLCGGYVGMTVPDNEGGTAWQVSSRIPINKWARYKPVECATSRYVKTLTHAQRRAVNFGITNIPVWNAQNCVYAMAMFWLKHIFEETDQQGHTTTYYPLCGNMNETRYWLYQPPTSAFRLSDFAMNLLDTNDPNYSKYSTHGTKFGYNGAAEGPIADPAALDFYIYPNGELNIPYQIPAPSAEEYIHISDLTYDGTNYYSVSSSNFAVLACRKDDSSKNGQVYCVLSCTAQRAVEPTEGGGGFAGLRIKFSSKDEVNEFLAQKSQKDFYMMAGLIRNSGTPTGDNNYVAFSATKSLPSGDICMALRDRIEISITALNAQVYATTGSAYVVRTKTDTIRINYTVKNFTYAPDGKTYPVTITKMRFIFYKNYIVNKTLDYPITINLGSGQEYSTYYQPAVDGNGADLTGVYNQVAVEVYTLQGVVLFNPEEHVMLLDIPASPQDSGSPTPDISA